MTDTIEEIRARHWELEQLGYLAHDDWASEAHADRAVLLARVAELEGAWTDDDQRGLNAAVADAMWYWDDMPMDPDDAISLTGILKDRLQENGFQIVRAAQALKETP